MQCFTLNILLRADGEMFWWASFPCSFARNLLFIRKCFLHLRTFLNILELITLVNAHHVVFPRRHVFRADGEIFWWGSFRSGFARNLLFTWKYFPHLRTFLYTLELIILVNAHHVVFPRQQVSSC